MTQRPTNVRYGITKNRTNFSYFHLFGSTTVKSLIDVFPRHGSVVLGGLHNVRFALAVCMGIYRRLIERADQFEIQLR